MGGSLHFLSALRSRGRRRREKERGERESRGHLFCPYPTLLKSVGVYSRALSFSHWRVKTGFSALLWVGIQLIYISCVVFFWSLPFEQTGWRTHTPRNQQNAWPTSAWARAQASLQIRSRETKPSTDSTVRKAWTKEGGIWKIWMDVWLQCNKVGMNSQNRPFWSRGSKISQVRNQKVLYGYTMSQSLFLNAIQMHSNFREHTSPSVLTRTSHTA